MSIRIKSAGSDDKPDEPDNEWNTGYGYQFWRCLEGSFRADGAFGQICIVSPQLDVVLAFNSGMNDVGTALGLVWKHIWPTLSGSALPENPAAWAALQEKLGVLSLPAPEGDSSSSASKRWKTKLSAPVTFSMAENPIQLKQITLSMQADVVNIEGVMAGGRFVGKCAFGRWENGCTDMFIGIAEAAGDPGAGTVAEIGENTLRLHFQQLCGPASMDMDITLDGQTLKLGGKMNAVFATT